MRNDYCHAYKDIKKFTKRVDELGERQRRVHMKIQKLERVDRGNMRKFQRKFAPLRIKTFKHARLGEKMMFRDKRLKEQFIKRVINFYLTFCTFSPGTINNFTRYSIILGVRH